MTEHAELLKWLGIASVAMFFGSLVLTPRLLLRLPADHFSCAKPGLRAQVKAAAPQRFVAILLRNAFGLILGVVGISMLVLPGQGLLAILVGFVLVDFPGRFVAERWIAKKRWALSAINWLRKRAGKPKCTFKEASTF